MRKLLLITVIILFTLSQSFAQVSQNKKNIITTGAQDRMFWAKTLYRISYPVIHNLANGTLKKNMPVEQTPDHYPDRQKVTYLEALGRTIAGVAPWLELPDDDTEEGKMRKQLRSELLKALANSVDPANPDYMNYRVDAQPIVDAAYVAHAFIRAPKALWEPLDALTKQRFITEFKSLRDRTGAYNNWLLFTGLTEGFLMDIGEQYDPLRVNFSINKINEWYAGDSWYADGPKFSMDYYNSYVIQPMLVDLLGLIVKHKKGSKEDYDLALKRMVRYSEYLERIIAPDGTYPAYGRSMTYRTAAFQALAQVALMEKLPEWVKPAQVRCALTKVMHNMYDGNQNFDKGGWLLMGFNGHQPMVADQYTSTGSLYMATLGFLTLGLPANNKFWTDAAAPWTSVKAWGGEAIKKDYKVEY